MKTSILIKALPLALLCAGVASAQKAGETISTEETAKLQIVDNSVFGEPKKGNSTAITQNNFSLVTSDEKEISSAKAGVSRANFTWQKKNTNTQKFEDYTNGTFASDGVYRLTAKYEITTIVERKSSVRSKQALKSVQLYTLTQKKQQECIDDVVEYTLVKEANVSEKSFNKVSEDVSATVEYSRSILNNINTYTFTCSQVTQAYTYASQEFTVGTAGKINFKTNCFDADGNDTTGCSAQYKTDATKYFDGDVVHFTVTSTNEAFGLQSGNLNGLKNGEMRTFSLDYPQGETEYPEYFSASTGSYYFTKTDGQDDDITVPLVAALYKVDYSITNGSGNGRIEGQKSIYKNNDYVIFDVIANDGYEFELLNASFAGKSGAVTIDANKFVCETIDTLVRCWYNQNQVDNIKIEGDLTVYGKFVKSPDAIELKLIPNAHAPYTVVSNGHEYTSSDKTVRVLSNAKGQSITVNIVPEEGYVVDSVYGFYTADIQDENVDLFNIATNLTEKNGSYSGTISVSLHKKAKMELGYQIRVITKKISNVTAEVSGLVKNVSLKDGDEDVCSLILEGEASSEECKLQEGKTYQVAIDAYTGYPLNDITCKGSGNNLCSTKSLEFQMPAEDVKISLEFNADKFDLSRDTDDYYTQNYTFYVNGEAVEKAHQFDTVYVKYNGPDTAFKFSTSPSVATHYVGVGEYFFVMPAAIVKGYGKEVHPVHNINIEYTSGKNGFIETVVDVIKKDGDSNFSQSWLSGSVAYTGQLVRFMRETGLGYSLDSVKCDVLEKGTMGTLVLETQGYSMPDRDLSCKFYTSPNPYDITLLDVDNGVVGKPSVGDKTVSEENPARTDDEVSFTVSPITGYEIDFVKVFYEIPTVAEGPESAPDTVEVETSKAANKSGYTYKFAMPANNVTIAAAFKEINTFTVTFKFGEETKTVKLESGKTPTAPESFKCTESTDEFTYSCAWDKEFAAVTGDVTYTYTQTKTKKSYVIKVAVNDTKMGSVSGLSESGKYEYGTEVKLTAKAKDGYEFSKWNDDVKTAERTVKVTGEKTYTATFKAKATSSSSSSKKTETKVSSSSAKSSSSSSKKTETKVSSSSAKAKSSSSKKKDAILASAQVPMFSVTTVARELQIAGAQVGASYAILDMQGRVMMLGRVDAANFSLSMPRAGSYMLRIAGQAQKVTLR